MYLDNYDFSVAFFFIWNEKFTHTVFNCSLNIACRLFTYTLSLYSMQYTWLLVYFERVEIKMKTQYTYTANTEFYSYLYIIGNEIFYFIYVISLLNIVSLQQFHHNLFLFLSFVLWSTI